MNSTPSASSCARRWLAPGLVVALYAVHLYSDARGRDAGSWMDPCQYYDFAALFPESARHLRDFAVPTIFPFCLAPFLKVAGPSVAGALWINILFVVILAWAVVRLCRQFEVTIPSWIVVAAVLSSPVLIGLSRELYIEWSLTAVCAWAFSLWFDWQQHPGWRRAVLFSAVFAFGFLLKTTIPIFFAGPFLVVAVRLVKEGKYRSCLGQAAAFFVPVALVVGMTCLLSPRSLRYYFSLGNTGIPIMQLIGPGPVFSAAALLYYPLDVWKTLLFLLTPFLVALPLWRTTRPALTGPTAALLWAWPAGAMLVLTLVRVKEPRHLAPCVVPLALLLARGISAIRVARIRHAVSGAVLAVSLLQYSLATFEFMDAPYYLKGSSGLNGIVEAMKNAGPLRQPYQGKSTLPDYYWRRTKNITLQGFDPNTALLLTWALQPAVVYNLDVLAENPGQFVDVPYDRFEDLFYFSAFNSYNRRCLCHHYYRTLDVQTIADNADYRLVCLKKHDSNGIEVPGFSKAAIVADDDNQIQVLAAERPSAHSYRSLYARQFLRTGRVRDPKDIAAVYFDLAVDAAIRGDLAGLNQIFAEYPLRHLLENNFPSGLRNIYWKQSDLSPLENVVQYLQRYAARMPPESGPGH